MCAAFSTRAVSRSRSADVRSQVAPADQLAREGGPVVGLDED